MNPARESDSGLSSRTGSISSRDIPFLPGTQFADPRKKDFKKAHVLDKNAVSVVIKDEAALAYPQGAVSNPLCERGTVRVNGVPERTIPAGTTELQSNYAPSQRTERGIIGCRKRLVTELPEGAPQIDHSAPFETLLSRNHDVERRYAKSVEKFEPAFVKLDGVVLRFYAWMQQEVQESQAERTRVRHVIIDYAVLDGTFGIYERPVANAGHLQGEILKRQKVPVDYRDPSAGYLQVQDLEIGKSVDIFGQMYNVYACSADTRAFFQQEGVELAADIPEDQIPRDEYITRRIARTVAETTRQDVTKHVADDKLAKYLRHDREVLNFHAYWDNRDAVFGEVRYFTVQYFLADDMLQVLEVLPPNSGRDPFPQFVKKQRVPKQYKMTMFSEHADATQEYYTARDFALGKTVDIFNRQMFIYDCDPFTRDYMIHEFGLPMDEVQPRDSRQKQIFDNRPSINNQESLQKCTRMEASRLFHSDVHGIGSEEDTIGSCMSVHPIPPKKNVVTWMKFGDLSLKFLAKFVPYKGKEVHVTDVERRFIVTYYFSDQTVSIFEVMGASASGFGNRFLERTKLRNTLKEEEQEADEYGRGQGAIYYTCEDFKPNSVIFGPGCALQLLDPVDQRTRDVMAGLKAVNYDLEKFD